MFCVNGTTKAAAMFRRSTAMSVVCECGTKETETDFSQTLIVRFSFSCGNVIVSQNTCKQKYFIKIG